MRGRRSRFARRGAALVLALALALPGCAGFGRASYKTYDWGGSTFAPNPVAFIPYGVGFVLFAIAFSPLDIISFPLTYFFFPDDVKEESKEFYWFSAVGPSIMGGVGGGTILGGIFYVFGIPFMPAEDDWSAQPPPSDDEPLPPPPGGDAPPEKPTEKPEKPDANGRSSEMPDEPKKDEPPR